MGQGRRLFTDEFKREAVALLAGSGRPLLQIASELGITWMILPTGVSASMAFRNRMNS